MKKYAFFCFWAVYISHSVTRPVYNDLTIKMATTSVLRNKRSVTQVTDARDNRFYRNRYYIDNVIRFFDLLL